MTNGTVNVDGCELTYVREGHGPVILSSGQQATTRKHFHTDCVSISI